MSDQQDVDPGQQNSDQRQPSPPQPTPGEDWEKRYKGSVAKIEELVLKNRELEGQLAAKASEIEQLRAQLSGKDVEKDVAVGEHRKQLEKALSDKSEAERELKELRALKAKLEVVKELEAPQLVPLLDRIPYVEDPEALKSVVKDFMEWGNSLVKQREEQLLAGVVPSPPRHSNSDGALPKTKDEWMKKIDSYPYGSPEREKAYQDMWTWGQSQQSR